MNYVGCSYSTTDLKELTSLKIKRKGCEIICDECSDQQTLSTNAQKIQASPLNQHVHITHLFMSLSLIYHSAVSKWNLQRRVIFVKLLKERDMILNLYEEILSSFWSSHVILLLGLKFVQIVRSLYLQSSQRNSHTQQSPQMSILTDERFYQKESHLRSQHGLG